MAISPRIVETPWRVPFRETPSTSSLPPPFFLRSLSETRFHVTSRFSFAKYAHVAIGHCSSYEPRDHVFPYVTKTIRKRVYLQFSPGEKRPVALMSNRAHGPSRSLPVEAKKLCTASVCTNDTQRCIAEKITAAGRG